MRRIMLASPEAPADARISLKPAGVPWGETISRPAFAADDLAAERARLTAARVAYRVSSEGDATIPKMAAFDDGCVSRIMLDQDPIGAGVHEASNGLRPLLGLWVGEVYGRLTW